MYSHKYSDRNDRQHIHGNVLYDLRKDPCEVHNVYEERGYLPIRRELTQLLAEKRGELGIR